MDVCSRADIWNIDADYAKFFNCGNFYSKLTIEIVCNTKSLELA